MMAYLVMMAPRIRELQRVLKRTGTIYLHCDPTASHYLKLLMDAVFGPSKFKNEIIWKRTTTKNDYIQGASNWPRVHDVLLYYSNGDKTTFTQPFAPLREEYIKSHYGLVDENGRKYQLTDLTAPGSGLRGHPRYEFMGVTRYWRYNQEKMEKLLSDGRIIQPRPGAVPRYKRYLDEMKGTAIGDVWWDIAPVNSQARERLGYPTQKPQALLERIIAANTREGEVVLDPFCGCGTAIEAAESLGRRWIGIDITLLAVAVIKNRLTKFGPGIFKQIKITGEPVTLEEAEALAESDKFGFQWWAVGKLGAPPIEEKKGRDRGVDGRIYFHDDAGSAKHIVISVKAGQVGPAAVRELRGVVERDHAAMGILVTVRQRTSEMQREAAVAGMYRSINGAYPKLQVITVEDMFTDKPINIPGKKLNPYEPKRPATVSQPAEQLRLLP